MEKKLPRSTENESESTATWSAKRLTTASTTRSALLN